MVWSAAVARFAAACVVFSTLIARSFAQEHRLLTNEPPLTLKNVAFYEDDKPNTEKWILAKASFVVHSEISHVGVALEFAGSVSPAFLWHDLEEAEVLERLKPDRYQDTIASILDPKIDCRPVGLGQLLDCVNAADIPRDRDALGRCITFASRVIRFLSGTCKCSHCGAELDESDCDKIPPLSAEGRARFGETWNRTAYELFVKRGADNAASLRSLGENFSDDADESDKMHASWNEALKKFCGF